MGILTSLFSAVSGLNTYGNAMSVIGNNIANVGTVGFKSSRASFADLVSASLGGGSSAAQVGLGVFLNDVQTSFAQGSLSNTGNTLDLAIDGNGFFGLRDNTGTTSYSRAGQFEVNNLGQIVDPSGRFLQGYQASATGVILGTVGNITLSTATVAPQATSTAAVVANLNSAATVPATAFDVTDATTYNFSNGITVYDTLGAQHQLRMYYVKTAVANTWNLYSQVDGGAATAQTNLVFNTSGVLTGGGAQTFSLPITGGAATPLLSVKRTVNESSATSSRADTTLRRALTDANSPSHVRIWSTMCDPDAPSQPPPASRSNHQGGTLVSGSATSGT